MKSTFLLIAIATAMTATVASAQMTLRPPPKDMVANKKTSFQKFSDRLKIGYFGVVTTPHLDNIEKGQWRNAAISPEFSAPKGEQKNNDTWPTNVWNQISFNYNFGAKMNFVVNPRFMVPLAHSKDMDFPEDKALFMLDDMLVGFQGVVLSDEAKKFNLWIRPGVRIPTSRASRNSGNGSPANGMDYANRTTHQMELAYNATYDFTKTWQLGLFGQFRQWVIEDQYGFDRFRIITAPFVQYSLGDTDRILVYYENMLETDRRRKPQNDRDPVFKDVWQNSFVAYSKDITPKFNVMPFLSVFINDRPITDKSLWLGAWISYQIK